MDPDKQGAVEYSERENRFGPSRTWDVQTAKIKIFDDSTIRATLDVPRVEGEGYIVGRIDRDENSDGIYECESIIPQSQEELIDAIRETLEDGVLSEAEAITLNSSVCRPLEEEERHSGAAIS